MHQILPSRLRIAIASFIHVTEHNDEQVRHWLEIESPMRIDFQVVANTCPKQGSVFLIVPSLRCSDSPVCVSSCLQISQGKERDGLILTDIQQLSIYRNESTYQKISAWTEFRMSLFPKTASGNLRTISTVLAELFLRPPVFGAAVFLM